MGKKFKRVILHVGWDKTGSSTIQYFLDQNRESVAKDFSISYPIGRWHPMLGSIMSSEPETYIYNDYMGLTCPEDIEKRDCQFLASFENSVNELSPNDILCVSYEGFISLDEAALRRLKEYLLQYSDLIDILAYVRPIFSYARSAISQRAKQGQPILRNGNLPCNEYKITLEKFFRVFGRANVYVRSFSQNELVLADVLSDFLSFCGVDQKEFKEKYRTPRRENESLSWPAIMFSNALIKNLEMRNIRYTVSDYARIIGARLSSIDGPRIPIGRDIAQSLSLKSKKDAIFLKEEYGINIEDANDFEDPPKLEAWQDIVESLADAASYPFEVALKSSGLGSKKDFEGYVSASSNTSLVSPGQCFQLEVLVGNTSNIKWAIDNKRGPKMSYHWKKNGEYFLFDGKRTSIPSNEILPGHEIKIVMDIFSPEEAGEYLLIVTAVEEGRCWLENEGLNPAYLKFFVS